jgi:cathepsin F
MKLAIFATLLGVAFCYSNEEVVRQAKLQLLINHKTAFPASLTAPTVPTQKDFEDFQQKYEKSYQDETEKARRFAIFQVNAVVAQALTASDKGTAKYGITKFADLSHAEFKQLYRGLKMPKGALAGQPIDVPTPRAVPASVDWRQKGAVTPVKNQGQCGSCWSFSTTGNVEGQWFLAKGNLVSLSEAELVDCDKVDHGCEGGLMVNAYKEIQRLGGLETEKAYPYHPEDGKCHFNRAKVVAYINGSVVLPTDEGKLASWCAANGPIAIGINADVMQMYQGGISHPTNDQCDPEFLDHGVLIVGYGTENGTPFWIVKNSWGPDWGEEGYYRAFRGGGVCGLNTACSSSIVDKN